MARCKCRICRAAINTNEAYLVVINNQKAYYCSQEEYDANKAAKDKAAAEKEKVYRLICEIIGRNEIVNTVLWKEKAVWNRVANDEIIGMYLEENKDYLTGVISRLEDKEFNRIRYLSTILKNNLGDFKKKIKTNDRYKTNVVVDETMYEQTTAQNNKRRSLEDLEDDI